MLLSLIANPNLSSKSFWSHFSRPHCGDAHQTPPEAFVETPMTLATLLSEVNQTNKYENILEI